jgi:hypothetical protein
MTESKAFTRDELAALLGQPYRELTQTKMKTAARRTINATYAAVHTGFAYRCGCKAVLGEAAGSYVLRPCGAHRNLA